MKNCLLILVHILWFSLAVLSSVLLCCSTLLHLLLQIQQVLLRGSHCTQHLKMLRSCCFIPRRAFSKCFRGSCCSWHNSCKVSRLSSMSVLWGQPSKVTASQSYTPKSQTYSKHAHTHTPGSYFGSACYCHWRQTRFQLSVKWLLTQLLTYYWPTNTNRKWTRCQAVIISYQRKMRIKPLLCVCVFVCVLLHMCSMQWLTCMTAGSFSFLRSSWCPL